MRKALLAGVLALALGSIVRGQEITEEEYLAAFGAGHEAVRALTGDIGRAEGARRSARLVANPRLEFWREEPDSNPTVTNWSLAWTPPLDGRYGVGKQAAEAGLAAAEDRFLLDRAALRREVRQVYADWSLACEARAILGQQLALVAGLAAQERERARAGEASGLAARRFALAAGEARLAMDNAEADCARAGALARGWRPDLPATAAPARMTLPAPPAALDVEGLPALRALENEAEQARLEARRSARHWGFPTLVLGWQTIEDREATDSGPILATNWTLPLFDRAQGARIEAGRREEVAAARLMTARTRVAAEVEGGLAAYRTLYGSARAAQETAREVDPVIEAATGAYRAGETGLTDLLESLRSAYAAALREVDARRRAFEAHRDLEVHLGRPLTDEGGPR